MKTIYTITIFLLFKLSLSAQLNNHIQSKSDTLFLPNDTIHKVVEIVKYEYYEPIPVELFVGAGINISQSIIHSETFDKKASSTGIPLIINLKKGNFYLQTGCQYQNLSFNKSVTEIVEKQIAHTTTETVVVDTYYRYNNGNPIAVVVTKEVETTQYEIIQEEITTNKKIDYTTLKVPLHVGYQLLFNKFYLRAEIGSAINMYTSEAQKNLNEDFPDANHHFFTYELGVGGGYAVSKKIYVDCGINMSTKTNTKSYNYSRNNLEFRIFYKIF